MNLEVLNPVALKAAPNVVVADRPSTLDGKMLGLFWNFKPGGDAALQRIGDALKARHPGLQTKLYVGSIGGAGHYLMPADVKRIAHECTAVVGATAD